VLRTEQDAADHAKPNLLDPIEQALNVDAAFTGKIYRTAQLGVKKLRVDVGIMYTDKVDKEGNSIVAMIEYKRAPLIANDQGDFEKSLWMRHELNSNFVPLTNNTARYLRENMHAMKHLKQAKAYVRRANCRYVALCNYTSLVLLKFLEADCRVIEVTLVDSGKIPLLLALIGFILQAIEHWRDTPKPM